MRLAARAVKGDARIQTLPGLADGGAAATTRLTAAAIDPQPLTRIHGAGGAPQSGEGHDRALAGRARVFAQEPAADRERLAQRIIRHRAHRCKGAEPHQEADLGLVDIAQAGGKTLLEEGLAQLQIGLRAQAAPRRAEMLEAVTKTAA